MGKLTRDLRKAIKAERWETLPKYYNRDKETVSAGGTVYYNLQISKAAKPKSVSDHFAKLRGLVFSHWVFKVLNLKA